MTKKVSVKGAARDAIRADQRARRQLSGASGGLGPASVTDSFTNFAQRLGIGADNPLSTGSYGFNPITRNRTMLEWIHRGSWLGGVAVDLMADDMTRKGVEFVSELSPDISEKLELLAVAGGIWGALNETIRWGRLYGGSLAVALIDGQDPRTPLRAETVSYGQFRGLAVLDRWMVEPSLEDLVDEYGPNMGLPRYYRVTSAAPCLRGQVVHFSRVMVRHVGIDLPYQQRLMENLWGISVLERLFDRMIAFDSASTGAAQLVYKSFLRTLSVEGLREVVATGGKPLDGLLSYTEMMRRFQGIEGITMIDAKDKFEAQSHSAFSGLSDVLTQFGQQLSGALQIPLVRLFGQSPAGLNSTGESDLRMFYDHVKQQQQKTLYHGVTMIYRLLAASAQIKLPPNFAVNFRSLWELTDTDKANVAKTTTDTVLAAHSDGLISDQVALRELRQSSRTTGIYSHITQEDIAAADPIPAPPAPEMPPGMGMGGEDPADPTANLENDDAGSQGDQGQVGQVTRGRVPLQRPATGGGAAGRIPRQGNSA